MPPEKTPRVDPVIAILLRALPDRDVDPESPERARADFRRLVKFAPYRGEGNAGGVEDFALEAGRRVRLYRPAAAGPAPTVVFFHGGGWVVGDLDGYDAQCRRLRDGTGAAVLSAEYRLAPEAPFPAAVEDCLGVVRWAARNVARLGGDAARLAVAGDSAGARRDCAARTAATVSGARLGRFALGSSVAALSLARALCDRLLPHHAANELVRRSLRPE